jgi:hypothetical protein
MELRAICRQLARGTEIDDDINRIKGLIAVELC